MKTQLIIGVGIVCHPHPLFQGTMHNKVAYMLAKSYLQKDMLAIRFNFRGVGKSEGKHANGIDEVDDLKAVFDWVKTQWPELKTNLAGFSFGSYVALRFIQNSNWCQTYGLQSLVTVAPPVGRWDFSSIKMPTFPVLVLQGLQDELVDANVVETWVTAFKEAPEIIKLAEADHFFHGQLIKLQDHVVNWLSTLN